MSVTRPTLIFLARGALRLLVPPLGAGSSSSQPHAVNEK